MPVYVLLYFQTHTLNCVIRSVDTAESTLEVGTPMQSADCRTAPGAYGVRTCGLSL